MKFAKAISSKKLSEFKLEDFPVDLVYLWVDGSDEVWQEKFRHYSEESLLSENRFSDNWELLFSLRSVEKNLPWVRNIFLVTDNQIPRWLLSTDKIQIIDHQEIIPQEYLPSFNSEFIELFLDRIPGLSEHFLYLNDDFFVINYLNKEYFFSSSGTPKIRLRKYKRDGYPDRLYYKSLNLTLDSFNAQFGTAFSFENSHGIDPFLKSSFTEWREKNFIKISELGWQKTRGLNSLQRISFSLYLLAKNRGIVVSDREVNKSIKYYSLHNLDYVAKDIKINKPSVICVNDDERTTEEDRKSFPLFLLSLFPKPSTFELVKFEELKLSDSSWKTIFTSFDENYSRYFIATLKSLKNNKGMAKWEVVVLEYDLTEKTKKVLLSEEDENFRIVFYNVVPFMLACSKDLKFKVRSYWSVATYFKCFIPLITNSSKDVLFCDSDVVFNSNPDCLFDKSTLKKSTKLLAVLDSASPCLKSLFPERLKQLQKIGVFDPECSYFNAGVLLFKLSRIEKKWYLEELISAAAKEDLPFQDQDILNVIFNRQTELQPIKFNYQQGVLIFNHNYFEYLSSELRREWEVSQKDLVIVHFTGSKKPWNSIEGTFNYLFWKNLRNCDEYEILLLECSKQLEIKKISKLERLKNSPWGPFADKVSRLFFPLGSDRREWLKALLSKR